MHIIDQYALILRGCGNLATISLLQTEVASALPVVPYPRSVLSTTNPAQMFPLDAAFVITAAVQEASCGLHG
jgi:hypothetical protein